VAVGLSGAVLAVLRGDNSAESGQHMIPKIRARTSPVNPSHSMSPASLGRLAPMIGAALVVMICPLMKFSPLGNAGAFIKFQR
jgi:hypothetical protein